jgi:proton glutamate symport protein
VRKLSPATQILFGLVAGIVIGSIYHGNEKLAVYLEPIGEIFLHLIQMIVIPIVISALIVGIASIDNIKKLGKIGGKTIIYFEIITTIAIIVGLAFAMFFQPGAEVDNAHVNKSDYQSYVKTAEEQDTTILHLLAQLVPKNIVASIVEGDLLAIIFFSILFGLAIAAVGERGKPALAFFQSILDIMYWITHLVMKFAPFGVFALIGVTVSKFGIASLLPLTKLILSVYGAMLFFIIVILGLVAKLIRINLFQFIRLFKEELFIAYLTASSESVLPKLMIKLERFGCPKSIISFVLPIGNSFNLAGSTLFQVMATLFIAQVYGIPITADKQFTIFLVLMITSKGIVGVPGASLVVLAATLKSLGIPDYGLALIVGIDRILDMMRTMVNVIGNSLATVAISKWERQYDIIKGFNARCATNKRQQTFIWD